MLDFNTYRASLYDVSPYSGDNLDVYFGHPVDELAKEDLPDAENLVLVVKERRFRRDSALNAALGEYPRRLYGEFAIVTVGPKE